MAKYLSQEWLDRQCELGRDLSPEAGASAVVQHVVTGGPDGDVRYVLTVEDGIVTTAALGADPDADVTLTTPYAEGVKVVGDMGRLLPLMVLGRTAEHARVRAALAAETDL